MFAWVWLEDGGPPWAIGVMLGYWFGLWQLKPISSGACILAPAVWNVCKAPLPIIVYHWRFYRDVCGRSLTRSLPRSCSTLVRKSLLVGHRGRCVATVCYFGQRDSNYQFHSLSQGWFVHMVQGLQAGVWQGDHWIGEFDAFNVGHRKRP